MCINTSPICLKNKCVCVCVFDLSAGKDALALNGKRLSFKLSLNSDEPVGHLGLKENQTSGRIHNLWVQSEQLPASLVDGQSRTEIWLMCRLESPVFWMWAWDFFSFRFSECSRRVEVGVSEICFHWRILLRASGITLRNTLPDKQFFLYCQRINHFSTKSAEEVEKLKLSFCKVSIRKSW